MSEQPAWDLRPWVPPGARAFRVGDRVRVRLSGECKKRLPHYDVLSDRYSRKKYLHEVGEDGAQGLILDVRKRGDHPIQIEYTSDWESMYGWCVSGWYAPSELELLSPAETAPTRAERPLGTRFARESTSDTSDTVRARETVDSAGEEG